MLCLNLVLGRLSQIRAIIYFGVSPLVRGRGLFRDFRTSDPGGLDLSGQRISLESGVHGLHWRFSGIATQKNASADGLFNDLGVSP